MCKIPLPARAVDAHKRQCGNILVIAGSRGMSGAGALAAMAALRSGAGLVTWAVPRGIAPIAEILCVEVLTLALPETKQESLSLSAREQLVEAAQEVDAVIMGSGMPVAGETGELMRLLATEIHAPLILDAGALRAIGTEHEIFRRRKAPTILTPHFGEMGDLLNLPIAEIKNNREALTNELAQKNHLIAVLKGANTIISNGEKTVTNQTGNAGMATAGAGDVLVGVIAALLGAKMSPFNAAVLGVHLHGLAGDIAMREKGLHGIIASDILTALPPAFMEYGKTR